MRILKKAVALLLLSTSFQLHEIAGEPSPCPNDPSVVGFSTISELNQWMSTIWYFINSGGFYPPPYFFSLCPNTIFEDSFVFPVLNDTWILCGGKGESSDNCILQQNETQVIILPHDYESEGAIAPTLEQVNFLGLTMKGSTDVSIGAYGSPSAWAFFKDCHWIEHTGRFAIHMLPPSEKSSTATQKVTASSKNMGDGASMFVQLVDCTFKNNKQTHSSIVNNGGTLVGTNLEFVNNENEWANILIYDDKWSRVEDSLFEKTSNYFTAIAINGELHLDNVNFNENTNMETVVHIIDGSSLTAENCVFTNNNNAIGPSMIDDESTLFYNFANAGTSNSGFGCEGFLLLEEGEVCDADGECPAICCDFGDTTCDVQTSVPSVSPTSSPTESPTTSLRPTEQQFEETDFVEPILAGISGKGTSSAVGALKPSESILALSLCAVTGLILL